MSQSGEGWEQKSVDTTVPSKALSFTFLVACFARVRMVGCAGIREKVNFDTFRSRPFFCQLALRDLSSLFLFSQRLKRFS